MVLIVHAVYWSLLWNALSLIGQWCIKITILWIPWTIVFNYFPGFEWNDSSQDIQCTKNTLYGGIDMADSRVLQKTSFKVTTTEAQEQESYYENWCCWEFFMEDHTNNYMYNYAHLAHEQRVLSLHTHPRSKTFSLKLSMQAGMTCKNWTGRLIWKTNLLWPTHATDVE